MVVALRKRANPIPQAAQHCWSDFDFGICLPQSPLPIFVCAQQLDPPGCGTALWRGSAPMLSDRESARKRKSLTADRIERKLTATREECKGEPAEIIQSCAICGG